MSIARITAVLSVLACPLALLADESPADMPPVGLFGGNFLFIMASMIAIIYFLMIRPEQKRQKERQKMLSSLKKGDKVLTVGGVVGVITAVKDTSYLVKSGENTILEFTKSAIQNHFVDSKDAGGTKDVSEEVKESK